MLRILIFHPIYYFFLFPIPPIHCLFFLIYKPQFLSFLVLKKFFNLPDSNSLIYCDLICIQISTILSFAIFFLLFIFKFNLLTSVNFCNPLNLPTTIIYFSLFVLLLFFQSFSNLDFFLPLIHILNHPFFNQFLQIFFFFLHLKNHHHPNYIYYLSYSGFYLKNNNMSCKSVLITTLLEYSHIL
jgi:hypothetical protein